MTGFRQVVASTLTVAVPFVICTRFSILPRLCDQAMGHLNVFHLSAIRIPPQQAFVNGFLKLGIAKTEKPC